MVEPYQLASRMRTTTQPKIVLTEDAKKEKGCVTKVKVELDLKFTF